MRVVDTKGWAKQIREAFQADDSKKEVSLHFSWPTHATLIGQGKAELYHSDKWKKHDDYKHVAEARQIVYLCPGTKIYDEDGELVRFGGEKSELNGPMPKHFAVLAPSLGLQMKLLSGQHVHVDIPGAIWGAAKHPESEETFLFLYDEDGVRFILTGEELDVTKDGIVG